MRIGAQRGVGPDDAEDGDADQAENEATQREQPDRDGEDRDADVDAAQQQRLVIGADVADGPPLHRLRRQQDEPIAHDDHGCGGGAHERGHDLADAQRHRRGQQSDRRPHATPSELGTHSSMVAHADRTIPRFV